MPSNGKPELESSSLLQHLVLLNGSCCCISDVKFEFIFLQCCYFYFFVDFVDVNFDDSHFKVILLNEH